MWGGLLAAKDWMIANRRKTKRKILAWGRTIELTWGTERGFSEVIIQEHPSFFTFICSVHQSPFVPWPCLSTAFSHGDIVMGVVLL